MTAEQQPGDARPLVAILLRSARVVLVLVEDVLARPTPDARDHAVVLGAHDDVRRWLGLEAPRPADEAAVLLVVPRAEILARAVAHGLEGTSAHIRDAAPAGAVHLVLVGEDLVSAGPTTPATLRSLVGRRADATVTSVSVAPRHAMDGWRPGQGRRRRN